MLGTQVACATYDSALERIIALAREPRATAVCPANTHIIGEARRSGMHRLSLETGSGPAFEPALALYRKRGFMEGEAFADYCRSDFNQFLHLAL